MEFDLRKYLQLVLSWWWLLALGVIIPAGTSYYFVSQQQDYYQARVVLMVGTTFQSANPNTNEMGVAMRLAQGYAEMVRYRPITNEVIRKLGLERSPEILADQISALVRPEANLLEIAVTDSSPQTAAAIANALADELIAQTPAGQAQGEQQRFVERQLEELKAKIEELQTDIEDNTARLSGLTSAAEIQAAEQDLNSAESVLSRYRTEYAALLNSYSAESVNQLTIVEPAVVPNKPIGRRALLVVGIAAAAGMGLALAGVFLIEYFDDTLQWDEKQDGELAGLPVLGVLPRMSASTEQVLNRAKEQSQEAERLRALRTMVLLRRMECDFDTLLITSPASGEGKSFTVSHLGVSLADAGLRVVIVDADMRKPSLHEVFDLPNVRGLSDLLRQAAPFESFTLANSLLASGVDQLFVLPAGPVPLDPTMLLMSANFSNLLENLQRQFDLVILDGPPALATRDVDVLSANVDAITIVVSHGISTRRQLADAIKYLSEGGQGELLGVIFDRVRLSRRRYGYYYYYGGQSSSPRWTKRVWRWLSERVGVAQRAKVGSDPDRFISLHEAAEQLGIRHRVARRWVREGRLPATRDGWFWRVDRDDLGALIDRQLAGDGNVFHASKNSGEPADGHSVSTLEDPESLPNAFVNRVSQWWRLGRDR